MWGIIFNNDDDDQELQEDGRYATLIEPYLGYSNIVLIRKIEYKWFVRICGSGKVIDVYEDEFILD